jgi:hypothetical protein
MSCDASVHSPVRSQGAKSNNRALMAGIRQPIWTWSCSWLRVASAQESYPLGREARVARRNPGPPLGEVDKQARKRRPG